MSYKAIALKAAQLAKSQKISPVKAWQLCAEKEFPASKSSQVKSCPKNTFLGLCEAGRLSGIPSGKYTSSILNKGYAITASNILSKSKNTSFNPLTLWTETLKVSKAEGSKQHNSQMDVVLALWENGLIKN